MDAQPSRTLKRLIRALSDIADRCVKLEKEFQSEITDIPPEQNASARNLLHYLALRQYDMRELQPLLSSYGLSSLGRTEAHTLASLHAVLHALRRLAGVPDKNQSPSLDPVNFSTGPALLARNAQRLLGSASGDRPVRIMVTIPGEAAADYDLVRGLMNSGMDAARINCAHDDQQVWRGMIENLRRAEAELGRKCVILMDLGGPKLRTGPRSGAKVLKWRPERDVLGKVLKPARLWLALKKGHSPPADADGVIPIVQTSTSEIRKKDRLEFTDTRDRDRTLEITAVEKAGLWAESPQSAIIQSGAELTIKRKSRSLGTCRVGDLPQVDNPLRLQPGDVVPLGGKAPKQGKHIAITLPEVLRDLKPGHRIFFDDGKIAGVVRRCRKTSAEVEITTGGKLGSDKGINLPDTDLNLPALTDQDLVDLDFAVANVDLIGFSFVRHAKDVARLQQELQRRSSNIGIVLKIENQTAFENLPKLLLAGLHSMPFGVMVARGDLAVELGFERLAEVQEQILWLCEAAHVPVIWATQVLESMAKKGQPSRAEVTDAAMSGRAECVMLNKGPHIVETVHFLNGILVRMKRHQNKKAAMLRRLSISDVRKRR